MKGILKIVEDECWSCKKPMKLAFFDNTISVDGFNDKLLEIAREHGVIIKSNFGGIDNDYYNTNVCSHCDSFVGQWYLPNYWYSTIIKSIEVEIDKIKNNEKNN
jgi:hypothetical protein